MQFQLRYSSRALKEYVQILQYIVKNFGNKKTKETDFQFQKTINQIVTNPYQFSASENFNSIRRCIFSKQTNIYYRIIDNFVEIASIRDNRMNPENIDLS